MSKYFRGLVYSVGLYKSWAVIGIPLYHMAYQYYKDFHNMEKRGGQYVAITGCTDGIGKALTLEFARRGYGTLLYGRNPEKLK